MNLQKWFADWYFNSDNVDQHRRGITDIDWAMMQPRGKPKYQLGDIVEFKSGGFGVIHEVSEEHNGWPASYSTRSVNGMKRHPRGKVAWHYELDFKRKLFWRTLLKFLSK